MATHSSILAWRIPWTEEPGRLRSMGLQRVRHHWALVRTIHTSNTTPGRIFRHNYNSKRSAQPYVHSSTIHSNQNMESAYMSIRWMNEDVVHVYNGMLLSHRKEWNNSICSNMDLTRDYRTKWNVRKKKTDTIGYHLYIESKIWHKWPYLWTKQNHGHEAQTGGCPGGGGRRRDRKGGCC